MYKFKKSRPVWCGNLTNQWNQFAGFYKEIILNEAQEITIAIAARSYYRLYVNNKMLANGPARTAHGYCRVDEIKLNACGGVKIAVEVAAMDKPGKYSNDCTLEPGLFAAEIADSSGRVLTATGDGSWGCRELTYRRSLVETMSHCRGIIEWCDLDESSYLTGYDLDVDRLQL